MRKLALTILFVVAALLLSAPCYAVNHAGDLITLVDQWGDPAVWVDSGANLWVGGAANYGMGVYGDTALFVTHTDTAVFVTHMDTPIFVTHNDTAAFLTHAETGIYVKHSDTGVFLIIGADTVLFMQYAAYFVETSREGQAGGIATLDSGGRIPTAQLPASIVGALTYQGTYDASSNTFPIAEPDTGAYWVISDTGSLVFKDSFDSVLPGDFIIYNGYADTWGWIQQQAPVSSVNTLTGDVTLTTNEIGEGSNNLYWTEPRFYAHTTTDTPNYLRQDDPMDTWVASADSAVFLTQATPLGETYLVRGSDTSAFVPTASASDTYLTRGVDTALIISGLSDTYLVRGGDTFTLNETYLVRGMDTGTFMATTSAPETFLVRGLDTGTFLSRGSDTDAFLTRSATDSNILNAIYMTWTREDSGAATTYPGENVIYANHFEAFNAKSMSSVWVPDNGDYDAATGFFPAGGIGDPEYFMEGFSGMTISAVPSAAPGNRIIYHPPHPVNLSGCDSFGIWVRTSLLNATDPVAFNMVDDVGGTMTMNIFARTGDIVDLGPVYFDTIASIADDSKSCIREMSFQIVSSDVLFYMWVDGMTAWKSSSFNYQITRDDTDDFLIRTDTSAGANLDVRYLFDTSTMVPYAGLDTAALVYTDTVTIADTGTMFVLNAAGAVGASLPSATGTSRKITIKGVGAGAVTVWPVAGQAIDWGDSRVVTQWGYVELIDYAAGLWAIISGG